MKPDGQEIFTLLSLIGVDHSLLVLIPQPDFSHCLSFRATFAPTLAAAHHHDLVVSRLVELFACLRCIMAHASGYECLIECFLQECEECTDEANRFILRDIAPYLDQHVQVVTVADTRHGEATGAYMRDGLAIGVF